MKNRAARIVIAIIFLAGFMFYTYRQEGIHSHSVDVESWGPAGGLKPEGYTSDGSIEDAAASDHAHAKSFHERFLLTESVPGRRRGTA